MDRTDEFGPLTETSSDHASTGRVEPGSPLPPILTDTIVFSFAYTHHRNDGMVSDTITKAPMGAPGDGPDISCGHSLKGN